MENPEPSVLKIYSRVLTAYKFTFRQLMNHRTMDESCLSDQITETQTVNDASVSPELSERQGQNGDLGIQFTSLPTMPHEHMNTCCFLSLQTAKKVSVFPVASPSSL